MYRLLLLTVLLTGLAAESGAQTAQEKGLSIAREVDRREFRLAGYKPRP